MKRIVLMVAFCLCTVASFAMLSTTEVRNIRAYLLTTLYNSYFSANSGTMAQVQHDLYGTPKGGDAT